MDEQIKKQILIECSHRCAICGVSLSLAQVHAVALRQAKDQVPKNLVCLCAKCFERVNEEKWGEEKLIEVKERPWVRRRYESPPLPTEPRATVVMTFDRGLRYIYEKDSKYLQSAISAFLEIDPREVQIESVEGEPLEVNVALPADSAEKILESFAAKDPLLTSLLLPLSVYAIKRKHIAMRWLSEGELNAFREEYRDLEKEIQSFFRGYYLSGLILVAAGLVGQQSKPFLELSVGNGGYNVYVFLGIALLNMASTTYLLHKSIAIHEVAQFITYLSRPDSVFNYWESWRRSPQNYGNRAHPFYYVMITVLPFLVSFLVLYHTGYILFTDPQVSLAKIKEHQIPQPSTSLIPSASIQLSGQLETGGEGNNANGGRSSLHLNGRWEAEKGRESEAETRLKEERQAYAVRLSGVFFIAKFFFGFVILAHLIPLRLAFINSRRQSRRWDDIKKLRGWRHLFQDMTINPAAIEVGQAADKRVVIYDKDADKFTREMTESELKVLTDRVKKEAQQDK